MAEKLSFGFRDIPACARYGFSARKIWIFFRTLVLSWIIWDFFVYLGFFAAGCDLASIWSESRLLPLPDSLFLMDTVPVILMAAGILLIVHVLMRGMLRVSKMTFQQIRGDDFYSGGESGRFLREHSAPLVSIPVMLLFALAAVFCFGALAGLISRIPAVGPVVTGLLSVPLWGVMLLGVLTVLGFFVALELVPVITACTSGDSFEAVFEVFSTLTSQSWRLFLYWFITVVTVILSGLLFMLFSSLAISALSMSVGAGSGSGSLVASMAGGPHMLAPEALPYFSDLISLGGMGEAAPWSGIAGVIAGISGTAVFLVILSYMLSGYTAGLTLTYIVLKYRKDGEDLMERADAEEQREFDKLYSGVTENTGAE